MAFNLEIGIDASGARKGAREINSALNSVGGKAKDTDRKLKSTKKSVDGLGNAFRKAARLAGIAAAAFAGIAAGKGIVGLADGFTQVNNRLKLVTGSEKELAVVQAELLRQAKQSFVSIEQQAETFQRVARGAGQFGFSQLEALKATEALADAVRISGVSAEAANAALIQFGQGLASGALRGDELRSVLEQTPRVAQALADSFGITVGALRNLGNEGKLTTGVVIPALLKEQKKLRAEAEKLTPTVSQSFQNFRTELTTTVGDVNTITGFTEALGTAISGATSLLPALAKGLVQVLSTMGLMLDAAATIGRGFGIIFGELVPGTIESTSRAALAARDALANMASPVQTVLLSVRILGIEFLNVLGQVGVAAQQLGNRLKGLGLIIAAQAAKAFTFTDKGDAAITAQLNTDLAAVGQQIDFLDSKSTLLSDARKQALTDVVNETTTARNAVNTQSAALDELNAERERNLANLEAELAGLTGGNSAKVSAGLDPEVIKLNLANDAALQLTKTLQDLGALQAKGGVTEAAVAKVVDDARKKFAKATGALTDDDIKKFNTANSAASAYADALDEIAKAAAGGASAEAVASATLDAAEAYEKATGAADKWTDSLEDAARIIEATRTPLEDMNKQLADARVLLNEDLISQDTFNRFKKQLEEAAGQTDFLRDIAKSAAEDIQGAFRDLFLEGTDSLDDFANQFGETLRRIAANFLANEAIKFLLGGDFGTGGSGQQFGGVLGGIAGLFSSGEAGADGSATDATPFGTTREEAGIGSGAAEFEAILASSAAKAGASIVEAAPSLTDAVTEAAAPGGGFAAGLTSIFGSILGGIGSLASGGGDLLASGIGAFAGAFADGGTVPAGQFGIAGEGGRPEIVSGPATVTPMTMAAPEVSLNIVNVTNPRDAVEAATNTNAGQKGIINAIRENPEAVKRELGLA